MNPKYKKIVILLVSFVLFAVAVKALFSDPGPVRTVALWGGFAGLIAIALWLTWTKRKRREG